ncbi:MAG: FHA domain-containing protein [Acidobacteria bacterium]|jgi:hypothetical protein|nr:FHA domain-containing protein [Acidobacteriota bacterium]
MKKCPTCGTENTDDSQYCDECGAMLAGGDGGRRSNIPLKIDAALEKATSKAAANFDSTTTGAPVFQSSSATSIEISQPSGNANQDAPAAFENEAARKFSADGEKANGARATLSLERGDAAGKQFAILEGESYIGRWDADNGVFPDVDLDKHDPEAKISRRHARIVSGGGAFSIEDLGSTNGTFVNRSRRLIPGVSHALRDGDEIIVGKTFLRFNVSE